jgi:hypothetical protein
MLVIGIVLIIMGIGCWSVSPVYFPQLYSPRAPLRAERLHGYGMVLIMCGMVLLAALGQHQ